jgi:hypothetical protein
MNDLILPLFIAMAGMACYALHAAFKIQDLEREIDFLKGIATDYKRNNEQLKKDNQNFRVAHLKFQDK